MPWNQWLCTIANIYELSQDLRTFVIEYPGACLSLLHCLEAFLHRLFHFIEKLVFALSLCRDSLCYSSAAGFPSLSQPADSEVCQQVALQSAWLPIEMLGGSRPAAQSSPTFCKPMGCSPEAPLSKGFSRREYWSGLPFPSPGDLPTPGIEPGSPALQADALPSEPPGK